MIGRTISHYRILEKLGGGGMGVVYKPEDTKLKRPVALKFLPPELTTDPEAKERFIREAQAASAFQHNNICSVHDIDETDDGQMFICMDLYKGETLRKKIARGPLKVEEAVDIAIQVALGLAEAHEHGIIHRDIKPANIMITDDGTAKIVDFGLAKLTGATKITRDRAAPGTAAYMSPEQIQGGEVDHRTDVWSFGVLLYEMITGRPPFRGEGEPVIGYRVLNESPTPVSLLRPDVPKEILKVIDRSLQKDRNARPRSMAEILEMLGERRARRLGLHLAAVSSKWRAWIITSSIVLVLAVALYFLWEAMFADRIALESTDNVVVYDFQNQTGQPVYDHSLTEAVLVSLQQSRHVRVLPRDRVAYARELLRIPNNQPLDSDSSPDSSRSMCFGLHRPRKDDQAKLCRLAT